MNNNVVLIDTSYIYHRVTATSVWCKKAEKEFNHENIYNNFISSITKLSKKLNVNVENMILCRDSRPVWRDKLYKEYKAKRTYSEYGPYIKELYKKISKLFNVVLRIKGAEADDIIAVLSFYFLNLSRKNHVYVVSNDKDFYQLPKLFKSRRIHLINNSLKEVDIDSISSNYLEEKIIKGDPSDNIKKLKKDYSHLEYLKNKQLIDLSYVPRQIQNEIFRTGYFPLNSNIKPLSIQLGFACLNTELREKNIFCSRTTRQKTVLDKGIPYVKELIKENIKDLKAHVEWNYENGIRFMRISSQLLPHYTNPNTERYDIEFIRKDLEEIGRLARLYKQRLTFHPDQFNVLSTKSEEIFQKTRNELKMHADMFDMMGLDTDSIMVIHGGGVYDNKEEAMERFIRNFRRLDENIRRRLVLENCEKCYNIEDVLYISSQVNIPVIFDTHHYNCYNQLASMESKTCKIIKKKLEKEARHYIPYILESWTRRNMKPKFHISEQRPNSRIGAHSDYVEIIPDYLLEIPEKFGLEVDLMIEAKMKEKSVFHLYQKYPQISPF